MIGVMAPPSDQTTLHLQKLAALVAQRRAQLGLSKEDAARRCGIAYMTYWKIEDAQTVRSTTYAKLEVGFGLRAGSCKAILDGAADSVVLEDGTELIEGGQIKRLDSETLSEVIPDAVTRGALLTVPELTGHQIQELKQQINEEVAKELRRRGIVP